MERKHVSVVLQTDEKTCDVCWVCRNGFAVQREEVVFVFVDVGKDFACVFLGCADEIVELGVSSW